MISLRAPTSMQGRGMSFQSSRVDLMTKDSPIGFHGKVIRETEIARDG
jgi:hypothetical protein